MQSILKQLHEEERAQIERANQDYIKQINAISKQNITVETKVKLFCNIAARLFVLRRNWLMANPHNLEIVEPVLTASWEKIKDQVKTETRQEGIDRCLDKADKRTSELFTIYINRILPFEIK